MSLHVKSNYCQCLVLKHLLLKCTRKIQQLMFLEYSRTVSRPTVLEQFKSLNVLEVPQAHFIFPI